ncbi:hypothetical protein RRG08_058000 [Elysia crispata]|uniref:Uncharacterized protein n=1 Tax=Elysia crispata TaxID=231223 RepID=A0AAE0Z031_9GAST|nr:hypothetical protein RRG08_058000 [Elysia crispata]
MLTSSFTSLRFYKCLCSHQNDDLGRSVSISWTLHNPGYIPYEKTRPQLDENCNRAHTATTRNSSYTSELSTRPSTSKNTSHLWTNTTTPLSNTTQMAETSTSSVPQKSDQTLTISLSVGCPFFHLLTTAFVVIVVCLKKRQQSRPRKAARSSLSDLDLYAIARDGNDSQTNQNEGTSEECGDTCTAYITAGSVYCTIGDDTQSPKNGQDNVRNCSQSSRGIRHEPCVTSAGDCGDKDTHKKPTGSETKDMAVNKQGQSGKGDGEYSRLNNGRKEATREVARSLLEIYNHGIPLDEGVNESNE